MITHYLKISIRNLMKYRMQSFISVMGLAVGFVCFALSIIWIQYETTYDSQYARSDRMYLFYQKSVFNQTGYSFTFTYKSFRELMDEFPEIESFVGMNVWNVDVEVDGAKHEGLKYLTTDSVFIDFFELKLLKGSLDFLHDDTKVAVTESCALRLFGTTDAIGRQYARNYDKKPFTVGAVFADLHHSNYDFDIWAECEYFNRLKQDENAGISEGVFTLHKGVDPDRLLDKMHNYDGDKYRRGLDGAGFIPIGEYHHSEYNEKSKIQFYYLILFAAVGVLIILCALFNYLSIFVIRLGIRRREIGLRKVCGANWSKLYAMFSVEYGLFIAISVVVSLLLTWGVRSWFEEMSGVSGSLYLPFMLYWVMVAGISLLVLILLVRHYAQSGIWMRESVMRKLAVFFQLTVSILMMFCMVVLMNQISFLQKGDLGWNRKNTATLLSIYPHDQLEEITRRMSAFATVDTLVPHTVALAPPSIRVSRSVMDWDGKVDTTSVDIGYEVKYHGDVVIPFYGIQLIEGRLPQRGDEKSVVVNEAFVKALGMVDPVGKHFGVATKNRVIAGVVKNSYIKPPTIPAAPTVFFFNEEYQTDQILIRVKDGQFDAFESQVRQMMAADYPDKLYNLINTEKWYDEFLYSEHLLGKLLTAVSLVCILIAAFGIYSLITLSCERRRKEIAIRKVNGAKVKDILLIFIREYVWLLVMASVIAFPVGYILMKQWLSGYVRQTAITPAIFILIFLGIAALITFCIGWRVWKTSRINPAEVIKGE